MSDQINRAALVGKIILGVVLFPAAVILAVPMTVLGAGWDYLCHCARKALL
jgi:hypothetical protein